MPDPGAVAHFERGNHLREQGDLAGAEEAWRAASQGSHHGAALSLGSLLYERGDWEGAEDEWAFAAGADESSIAIRAVTNYGRLISELEFSSDTPVGRGRGAKSIQRDTADADPLWRRAADSGDSEAPWAYVGLGRLYDPTELADVPDRRRSEWAYEQAAASGHPDAAPCALHKLARLRHEFGRRAGGDGLGPAIEAFTRGAESGHREWAPHCAKRLAEIYAEAGDLRSAEQWWRAVVESGHPVLAPVAERALTPQPRLEDEADLVFDIPCHEADALDRFDGAMARLGWRGELEAAGSYDHVTREVGPHRLVCMSKGGLLSRGNRILVLLQQADDNRTRVGLGGGTPAERQRLRKALG
jgi:hypothetical protein